MRFAVESWAPEYGSAGEVGGEANGLDPSQAGVDAAVEVAPAQWAPVDPEATVPPSRMLFVDGVRRIDARVWITGEDGVARSGMAASYAAGLVRCDGRAQVGAVAVRRGVFSAAPSLAPLPTRHGTYQPCVVAGESPEELSRGLQQRMGELEARVVAEAEAADLVLVDGPLNKLPALPHAVGYIKTHQRSYLPDELAGVVAALRPGQRTPLFVTSTSWSRYCWYARLPGGDGHPWAGVVRGEVSGDLAVADARRRADQVTATLPDFATAAHKDPRAPQNLHPIAELERVLRHHLGDPTLLYRCLRAAAARA